MKKFWNSNWKIYQGVKEIHDNNFMAMSRVL